MQQGFDFYFLYIEGVKIMNFDELNQEQLNDLIVAYTTVPENEGIIRNAGVLEGASAGFYFGYTESPKEIEFSRKLT
jgi:hypothetical protein